MTKRTPWTMAANAVLAGLLALVLTACGSGGSTVLIGGSVAPGNFLISGKVSGLTAGEQVVILNNGADPTTISSSGVFTFTTPVVRNGTYSITIDSQPAGETCTVSNGTGAGVTANVANVTVACSTGTYSIGGTVTGLTANEQVTLKNNDANATTLTADGPFTFKSLVALDGSYAVTVGTQPIGEMCTVTGGSGEGVTANVAAVSVACSVDTFIIGGTVAGLGDGVQVTLKNNGGDATTVMANGVFTFSTPVAYGTGYAVTVTTEPTGQTCTPTGGSGTNVTANISSVAISCSADTYTIGGTITNLGGGLQVTLSNAGHSNTFLASGPFTFSTPVVYGAGYNVTVGTQPVGQHCTVTGATGTDVTANVTSVGVACVPTYSVSGTITFLNSGAPSPATFELYNTVNAVVTDLGLYTANSPPNFTFISAVVSGGAYSLSTNSMYCNITNGSSSNVTSNVTNVVIDCQAL